MQPTVQITAPKAFEVQLSRNGQAATRSPHCILQVVYLRLHQLYSSDLRLLHVELFD